MHRGADTGGVLDTRAREVGHHASVVGLSRQRCGGYHRQPGSLDLELSDLVEGVERVTLLKPKVRSSRDIALNKPYILTKLG